MIKRQIALSVDSALTRNRAVRLVQAANLFQSRLMIEQGSRLISAKSMLGLLSLNMERQESVTLCADGPDEQEAVECLASLLVE